MKKIILFFALMAITPFSIFAQSTAVTLSGKIEIIENTQNIPLAYVNMLLKRATDSSFVAGTITDENGIFSFSGLTQGNYVLETSYLGFQTLQKAVLIGSLSNFLDLGTLILEENSQALEEVVVTGKQSEVAAKLDKKSYAVGDNVSQSGGSVLQAMSNLPSVTVSQEGKVQLRGSDKVVVLIDGKQTALTGFDTQKGLDNIPSSAIERIEIINNPSSKYDANGNAGIINIILKKENKDGLNGKIGLSGGLGALWIKKENLPTIRTQFQRTPKINPSLSLNYRKNKLNWFLQTDWLYTLTLNENEFSTRIYDNGEVIYQQVKRNRTTDYTTAKTGLDYAFNDNNTLNFSLLFNREKIDDKGDNPYFLNTYENRYRLWQFVEDEVKYTASATAIYAHKFQQPGHLLNLSGSYYFHREDEKYAFTNILPTSTGTDAFKLLSDESVFDFNVDYVKPLQQGRLETGLKFRRRGIPTNMEFFPGINSPLDTNAGGWANYYEIIPAVYGNYVYETNKIEIEAGLRLEYVNVNYEVNPNHNTYKSDGYNYTQPFPSLRFGYKMNDNNKFSLFYNRRVDRPNEVDIRIFPKYDEPELIKVGNPTLKPQFTNTIELGYKNSMEKGSFYAALYHRITDGTITRIATQVPSSILLYNIFQNAGRSYNTGLELIFQQKAADWIAYTASSNIYQNTINAYSVTNEYPVPTVYSAEKQQLISGNIKLNAILKLKNNYNAQISAIYLAPDLIPQGKVFSRYSVDAGVKKSIQEGKGELFLNATDIFNTLRVRKDINSSTFVIQSTNYYETQVFRLGYTYKF